MATQLNFAQQMDAVLKTLGDARPRLLIISFRIQEKLQYIVRVLVMASVLMEAMHIQEQ